MAIDFLKLKEPQFVEDFLASRLSNYFPEIKNPQIKNLKIKILKEFENEPVAIIVLAQSTIVDDQQNEINKLFILNGKETKDRSKDFTLMDYLWNNNFSSGRLKVAKPLEYLKDEKLFIYEAAPGFPLLHFIFKERKDIDKKFFLAGKWLKKLHDIYPPENLISQNIMLKEILNSNLEELIKNNRHNLNLNLINQKAENLIKKLNDSNQKSVFCHGDFQIENAIFDEDGTLTVIDFEKSFLGNEMADIASFLVQLENVPFREDLKNPIADQEIKDWKKSFLNGYGESDFSLLEDFKNFYRLNILLYTFVMEEREEQIIVTKKALDELFLKI